MKIKHVLLLAAVVLMAVVSASCAKKDAGVIKIGVAGAHTGDLASYGLPTVNAATLVAEEFNAKGGINGRKVELVVVDAQCKPELATNAAAKLVSDKVVAV